MTYLSIRRAMRIATVVSWAGASAAAVVCTATGLDAEVSQILTVAVLAAIITSTAAVVEVLASVAERIVAAMPTADEIAAKAILHGQVLTRDQLTHDADVIRIGDYRG